jgi:hypothetical protein
VLVAKTIYDSSWILWVLLFFIVVAILGRLLARRR